MRSERKARGVPLCASAAALLDQFRKNEIAISFGVSAPIDIPIGV
ncbi:MAG: hypothetical protein R2912_06240 [Eubacteriales bacterium]